MKKATWRLTCSRGAAVWMALVLAIDARDAMARGLTSPAGAGRLLGEELAVPVSVLSEMPCNGDKVARAEACGMSLEVECLGEKEFFVWADGVCQRRTRDAQEGLQWGEEYERAGSASYVVDEDGERIVTPSMYAAEWVAAQ